MDLLVALDVQSRFNEPNNFYLCTIAMVEGKVVASLEIALRLIPIGGCPICSIWQCIHNGGGGALGHGCYGRVRC